MSDVEMNDADDRVDQIEGDVKQEVVEDIEKHEDADLLPADDQPVSAKEELVEETDEQAEPAADDSEQQADKTGADEDGDDNEANELDEDLSMNGDPGNVDDLNDYDPLLDTETLQPLLQRREKSLKDLLSAMDEYAPIIPDAVTDYYLAKAGFKTNDQRIKRLLALATQKFVSDIASDAYQFSRIRSQSGASAANPARGRSTAGGKTVLTMEDLSTVLTEYGINARRPEFYR